MFSTLRKLTTAAAIVAATLAMSAGAYAAQITNASFGVAGGFTIPPGTDLGNTDSITITNGGHVTVVTPDTGDLAALVTLGESGTMQSMPDLDGFTATPNFLTLMSGVSLDLNTLTINSRAGGP